MPTQWSEAEQVPLGCIAPPFYERTPVDFVGGDAHIAPHTASAVSFRASDRCHWRGNPPRRARRRGNPRRPCAKGGGAKRRRERYAAAAPRHQAKRDIPRPGAGYFCPRRQKYPKTPPKTTFLDFLTRLRPQLISLVFPRDRRAVEISPKCCIVSAPLFAAAFALKCRAVQAWQEHFLNSGPWPPPTFAASRQRRDLIIAHPRGEVSKGEGSRPLPFGRFKGKGFLRKGGNRNPPFLKWRSLVTFFRQGKKVTRRRHPAPGRGTPLHHFRGKK